MPLIRLTRPDTIQNIQTIQNAIDICASQGGGTIEIPAGEWLTGPLHMQSNIHLVLEKGARVMFSSCPEDYLPVVFTRWEGMECYNYSPLIYAKDCSNISITGSGLLFGNGQKWWHWKKLQQRAAEELCYAEAEGIPVEQRIYGTAQAALRPSFIQFISCRDILLEDFCISEGPQWTIHPVYCENVVVRNVTVHTTGPNTDGLNPDSCNHVLIEGCHFSTGDDCIALNSGMNEDGWRVNRPCTDIEIRNCTMEGGHGGIVIGSAVSGGVSQVYAHDLTIRNTMQGIRLKTMRGRGGYVRDAVFENIRIENVSHQAIQVNMFYEFSTVEPKNQTPSAFSGLRFRNISGSSAASGIELKGLPESPLEDITLSGINLLADTALTSSSVADISLNDVCLQTAAPEDR